MNNLTPEIALAVIVNLVKAGTDAETFAQICIGMVNGDRGPTAAEWRKAGVDEDTASDWVDAVANNRPLPTTA